MTYLTMFFIFAATWLMFWIINIFVLFPICYKLYNDRHNGIGHKDVKFALTGPLGAALATVFIILEGSKKATDFLIWMVNKAWGFRE